MFRKLPSRRHFTTLSWLIVVAALLAVPGVVSSQPVEKDQRGPRQIGRFVHIPLPIDGRVYKRTQQIVRHAIDKAKNENARLTLIFQFDVPKGAKGQRNVGRGSEFGASYDLADWLSSRELDGVNTVAYLPESIQGHAVLVTMACEEIVMAPEATIGAAGIDEANLNATIRGAYTEIASRRHTIVKAIALAMLDPAVKVLRVKTTGDVKIVTPEELAQVKREHATEEPVVIKPAGEQAEFSGNEARRLGIARYLAADPQAVARALKLPQTAVGNDPSLEGGWRPVRVDLKGPIRAEAVKQARNLIEQQVRDNGVNFVCLWIDSAGGPVDDAMYLADYLAFQLDPGKVRTVAYVPREARSDAAIIALACDEVVMSPQAVLGGSGVHELSADEVSQVRQTIQNRLAKQKGRSWSLVAAMIDPRLDVFRATHLGEVEYFSDAELKEQAEPDQWDRGQMVTLPGIPLKLTGTQAEEYRLVNRLVDSFAEFKQYYGIDDPKLLEPGWADFLIDALRSPGVAVLLLLIGGAALYIELHAPGIGIGGFVATVCFLLFFWSRYLGGTADWLAVVLFVAGVACILLEIFVLPGFGIFGLGGGVLVLASLVLASQTFIFPRNEYQLDQLERTLGTLAVAALSLIAVAVLLRKHMPRSRLFGRMMLEPPAGEEAETISRREALVDFHGLLGARGTTTTLLAPGGKARFGDLLVDVISAGEAIDRGAKVEVVEVHGNRVLVHELGES